METGMMAGVLCLVVSWLVALAATRRRRAGVNPSPPHLISTLQATLWRNRPKQAVAALEAASAMLN